MTDLMDIHRKAMRLVDQAEHLRREGDAEGSRAQLLEALKHESRAAALSAPDMALEPTRSVLHRSAAALALRCCEFREAERLIATALAGNPPERIAEELRDLLEEVYFERPRKGGRRPFRSG
jgi:hypothetical protein